MTTWKEMAWMLAARLENHVEGCQQHPISEEDPENCPFCHDRAAYRQFRHKWDREAR